MPTFLRRLLVDDTGQDMIEYALLTAFIGIAGIAALDALETAIGTTYGSWNTSNNDLWETPNPLP